MLLPGVAGFAGADYVVYNPSYFALPALEDFAVADPQGPWTQLIKDGLVWADKARLGPDHLPPDWVRIRADGTVTAAPDRPPRFGFDAIRTPMYLVWGGERKHPLVDAVRRFWSRSFPTSRRPPAWIDLTDGKTAPYPLSDGGLAIAGLIGAKAAPLQAVEEPVPMAGFLRNYAPAREEVQDAPTPAGQTLLKDLFARMTASD